MNTTYPSEYLTLKAGESQNLAEIYDKKLVDRKRCRPGPLYGAHCAYCLNETVPNHGITLFSKVRLNITNLQIIGKHKYLFSVLICRKLNKLLFLKPTISRLHMRFMVALCRSAIREIASVLCPIVKKFVLKFLYWIQFLSKFSYTMNLKFRRA
jgi:hypothetical protein